MQLAFKLKMLLARTSETYQLVDQGESIEDMAGNTLVMLQQ